MDFGRCVKQVQVCAGVVRQVYTWERPQQVWRDCKRGLNRCIGRVLTGAQVWEIA